MGFDYEDPNVTGYRSKMILMDIMGNLNEIAITGDLGWNWGSDNYINEDIVYWRTMEITWFLIMFRQVNLK